MDNAKITLIKAKEIVVNECRNMTTSYGEWHKYEKRNSDLINISLDNTLLVKFQNPTAKKLLSFKEWNDNSFYIKRGSKAIAIEDDKAPKGISNVFDVGQTFLIKSFLNKPNEENLDKLSLSPSMSYAIIKKFNEEYNQYNFKTINDIFIFMAYSQLGGVINNLSEQNLFEDIVKPCIKDEYNEKMLFDFICYTYYCSLSYRYDNAPSAFSEISLHNFDEKDFNNFLSQLSINYNEFRFISQNVKLHTDEQINSLDLIIKNNFFENIDISGFLIYDIIGLVYTKGGITDERKNNLLEIRRGGLSSAEHRIGESTNTIRQVWTHENEVYRFRGPILSRRTRYNRFLLETFKSSRHRDEQNGNRIGSEDGGTRGSERRIESQRSNEVDSRDEQHSFESGGNNSSRNGIHQEIFTSLNNVIDHNKEVLYPLLENGKYETFFNFFKELRDNLLIQAVNNYNRVNSTSYDFDTVNINESDYNSFFFEISHDESRQAILDEYIITYNPENEKIISHDLSNLNTISFQTFSEIILDLFMVLAASKYAQDYANEVSATLEISGSYSISNTIISFSEHRFVGEHFNYVDEKVSTSFTYVSKFVEILNAENTQLKLLQDKINLNIDQQMGYYKTGFRISFLDEDNKLDTYNGRYDLGSDNINIIEHVKEHIEYNLADLDGDSQETEEGINKLNKFKNEILPIWEKYTPSKTIKDFGLNDFSEISNNMEEVSVVNNINKELKEERELTLFDFVNQNEKVNEKEELTQNTESNIIKTPSAEDEKSNYQITAKEINYGTPKERYANNINAIKTLKLIENENRHATKNEQDILAAYVGWGGLSEVFDINKWEKEYLELKDLLDINEYNLAKNSVLNSHYTNIEVIDAIYDTVSNFGFKGGNILEPSMGIGNFFGRLPQTMINSRLYGVELDNISGRIAKQLYPNANIQIKGFEKTQFSDNIFDLVIGNVPFGDFGVNDPAYNKYNFSIHDYFIAKSLNKLRPGGILALITSTSTLDKLNSKAREYYSNLAEMVGTIKLPNNAFKKNAGTSVVSDIIFMQKRDYPKDYEFPVWLKTSPQYFLKGRKTLHNSIHELSISVKEDIMNGRNFEQYIEILTKYSSNTNNSLISEIKEKLNSNSLILANDIEHLKELTININVIDSGFLKENARLVNSENGALFLINLCDERNINPVNLLLFLSQREGYYDYSINYLADRIVSALKDSVQLSNYFVNNPNYIAGNLQVVTSQFGFDYTVFESENISIYNNIMAKTKDFEANYIERVKSSNDFELTNQINIIEYDINDNISNFSYVIKDDNIYFRKDLILTEITHLNITQKEQHKALIELRDLFKEGIKTQQKFIEDELFQEWLIKFNECYDNYYNKYGPLHKKTVSSLFNMDSSIYLLLSLEKTDSKNNYIGKSDIFTKRTILPVLKVTKVDNAFETIPISLNEKGELNISYMASLCNQSTDDIINELSGLIFLDPTLKRYVTADEYLSGNIREKLQIATKYAKTDSQYQINVLKLQNVQNDPLSYSDINIRLGATWLPTQYYNEFMKHVFDLSKYQISGTYGVKIEFDKISNEFKIKNKAKLSSGIFSSYNVSSVGGTINGYRLLVDCLNLRDTKIYYTNSEDKRVLEKEATLNAQAKQEQLKVEFDKWIYSNPNRRTEIVNLYNEIFNSIRTREFDGSFLTFPNMSNEITLKDYQKNAVARILYGGNTLLGHVVGAGKTYEMITAVMEGKRLGIWNKPVITVPKSLIDQWANEFIRLYPTCNILCATEKDFEASKRKEFCSRILTGDYDAIIMGHTQFEMIPLSVERQIAYINKELDELEKLTYLKNDRATVKNVEKAKKVLDVKLQKLLGTTKKDNVIDFEELGIDSIFVDEAHMYKNLSMVTKLSNIAGISSSSSQRATDMYNKIKYINEKSGVEKGIVFATGTPLSNSMTELYTMMKYLEEPYLIKNNLATFDDFASNFGEIVSSIELKPDSSGFQAKKRFAKFYNIPELTNIFKLVADIKTADMLKLPVPIAEYIDEVIKPNEFQKEYIKYLGERADAIHNGAVDPSVDNMLKVTSDGKKCALDMRLVEDSQFSIGNNTNKYLTKLNKCAENVCDIYSNTANVLGTQLILCDMSIPSKDKFNVYDEIKTLLIERGIPSEEIAFIHTAKNNLNLENMFDRVRKGEIRVLLGSTQKLGTGVNVQTRLAALHHLDVPWRPSDIEQREGRIIRQGNLLSKVKIFKYVTEGTFDAYSWQTIENKQRFIGQIMTSKAPTRIASDVDELAMSYATIKALATQNPLIKEKMELEKDFALLKRSRSMFLDSKTRLLDDIEINYPRKIKLLTARVANFKEDLLFLTKNINALLHNQTDNNCVDINEMQKNEILPFKIKLNNCIFADRQEARKELNTIASNLSEENMTSCGEYLGFKVYKIYDYDLFDNKTVMIQFKNAATYNISLGSDSANFFNRVNKEFESINNAYQFNKSQLEIDTEGLKKCKIEIEKTFEKENEFINIQEKLKELDILLNVDNNKDKNELNNWEISMETEQQETVMNVEMVR